MLTKRALIVIMGLMLAGCMLSAATEPPQSVTLPALATNTPRPTIIITETPRPYPWTDESAIMSGICFEAAWDAANQLFVLRNAEQHIRFYVLADNSQLCRRAVARYPFDFESGRVLAGLWSIGRGCVARHDVFDVERNDEAQTLNIRLMFVTEGDCPYELVRPFWIGLNGVSEYQINITVEVAA